MQRIGGDPERWSEYFFLSAEATHELRAYICTAAGEYDLLNWLVRQSWMRINLGKHRGRGGFFRRWSGQGFSCHWARGCGRVWPALCA